MPDDRRTVHVARALRAPLAATALATALLGVGSCAGDGPVAPPPAPVVASIAVAPGADTLVTLGRTRQFTATARDGAGAVVAGAALRWRSSDTLVARVDSLTGLVTAAGPGNASITAAVGNVTGTAGVAVIQFVASVSVTPATTDLVTVVQQVALGAVARDSSNAVVAGVKFLWVSSDPSVVTVDTLGVARSVRAGSATISATGRGTPGYATVNVNQAAANLVFITQPSTPVAGAGISPAVQVEVRDQFGARVATADHAVTVALGISPPGATLTGTRTVDAIAGIATFTGLSADIAYGSYTLVATSPGLIGQTSQTFSVTPGPVARLTAVFSPAQQVDVGPPGPSRVYAWDDYGNPTDATNLAGTLVFSTEQPRIAMSLGTASTPEPGLTEYTGPTFDRPVRGARIRFTAGLPSQGIEVQTPAMDVTTTASGLAAGSSHACIRGATNTFCWGAALQGQLGNSGNTLSHGYAAPVIGGQGLGGLTAAGTFSCGLNGTGDALCWGGRFGTTGTAVPLNGGGPSIAFTALSAGLDWVCGLTASGEVWCLGENPAGLGDGVTTSSTQLVRVAGSGTPGHVYTRLDVGRAHACALTAAGEAWCWGQNAGALGDSTMVDRATPVLVSGSGTGARVFTRIAIGDYHTCAINAAGALWCWGDNTFGQLGGNVPALPRVPIPVIANVFADPVFTSVVAGAYHTCATSGGEVWCWGRNDDGQLGNGAFVTSALMSRVPGLVSIVRLALGDRFTCAQTNTGSYCWGANDLAQLGIGTASVLVQSLPVRVPH